MSADQAQITLESLQCHFTWSLNRSPSILLLLRDKMEDMGSEEGNRWGGHIYNLRGFIQFKLEQHDDAVTLFKEAAEVFQRVRGEERGPWLVVNYGNLAWLHHLLGDEEQSQVYLSKVGALMEQHPPPPEGELHAEVCAEKAWTLMFLRGDVELAADLFQRAVSLQPEMVEWNSSHVLSLVGAQEHRGAEVTPDLLEKMRQAKKQDPENLYLAVFLLEQRAKRGESVIDEAHEITRKVLETPVGSYSCLRALFRIYKNHLSIDGYIDLAEEALKKHPDQRYLKTFLASGYKHKISFWRYQRPSPGMIDRAISLQEEVVSLYPHSPLMRKLDLADLYAKSGSHQAKAEQIFEELLHIDLEPAEKQLLYNAYARYLNYDRNELSRSIHFHMKAAEIPEKSYFRGRSIVFLEKIKNKGIMCREIEEFLEHLKEVESENKN